MSCYICGTIVSRLCDDILTFVARSFHVRETTYFFEVKTYFFEAEIYFLAAEIRFLAAEIRFFAAENTFSLSLMPLFALILQHVERTIGLLEAENSKYRCHGNEAKAPCREGG